VTVSPPMPHSRGMSRKIKTEPCDTLKPLLIEPELVAYLISSSLPIVEQLIKEGYFGVRTVKGRRLVRFEDVLAFVGRDDPEPVNFPPCEAARA
jgi:hypothetical protein